MSTNDRLLQIWLDIRADRIGLADALNGNTITDTVSVFIDEKLEDAPYGELLSLFDAIGSLASLRHFYIYSFGASTFGVLPVELLARVMKHKDTKLETLTLYFLELGGSLVEYLLFEESLRYHPSLQEFRLESCQLSNEGLELYSTGRLLISLSTIPNLEKVEISATDTGSLGALPGRAIETICDSYILTTLSLINFPFSNEHITAIKKGLATNRNLKDLALSCDPKASSKLPDLLQEESLEIFKLRLNTLENDEFIQAIAKSLKTNTSLKRFDLRGEIKNRLSIKSQQVFVAAMERNTTIENLEVPIPVDELQKKIKLYLKLNQSNRSLYQCPSATNTKLVESLILSSNDLDCIFSFLSMRPSLCQQLGVS